MDVSSILSMILGGGGILSGIIAWVGNRRLAAAQAKQTEALADVSVTDYVGKIITQADKRVEQYEADAKNWREKITETEAYAKEQRVANNALREKITQMKDELHKSELENRDLNHALVVSDYARCTDEICKKRVPPRKFDKLQE